MKKLFTAIMVIAVLLCTATAGVYAKSLDPYGEIYTLEYDKTELSLPAGKTDFTHQNGYIGDLGTGGAVVYRNVDFGNLTPKTAILYAGLPLNHAGRVDLRLDSATGTTIAIFQLKGTDWSVRTEQRSDVLAKISGVHDVWLVQVGGNCRAYSFKFIPEEYELEPVGQYDALGDYLSGVRKEDRFFCELIGGLGFTAGQDTVDPAFPVTRGSFVAFIDWVMNYGDDGEKHFIDVSREHEYYDAITRLSNHGIIKGYGDLTFRPDKFITGEEAVTICANALGYNKLPGNGYAVKKLELITDSGIKNVSEPLNTLSAMKILYSFLKSDYVYVDIGNEEIIEKKNILEYTRNIYLRKGVVDGNRLGYIENPAQNTEKGYVTVDKKMFMANECNAEQYLGRNCEYFVLEDKSNDYDEIVSIAQERRSVEYVITHDNEPYISNNTLYYENEDGREKKIKLSQSTVIIYNQKTYENADISQVLDMQNLKYENGLWISNGRKEKEFQGEIRAVSYEGGNYADVIYVNSYENVVYDGYDSYNHVLRNKISDREYYINVTDAENYGIVTIDGVVSSVDDLEDNMGGVIYESINVDGIKAVNAYYTTDTITGIIGAFKEDETQINSVFYKIAPEFLELGKLEIGYEGDFVLSPYGEIVWIITEVASANNQKDRIVCFIRGFESDDGETAHIRVYDLTDGAVAEYTLAESVRFEGERIKNVYQAMNGTPTYEDRMGIKSLKKGYVMRIRLNADNKVNFVDSPVTCSGGINDCLKMLTASVDGESLIYRPDPKIFGSRAQGNKFAVQADAPVLYSASPSSDTYEYDGFRLDTLSSLGRTDREQQVCLFAFNDESSIASFVVKFTDNVADINNQIYVYNGISGEVLGHNEEATWEIEVCEHGMMTEYIVSPKYIRTNSFSSIPKGSLVKLGFDAYGEVIAVNVVYTPDGSAGLITQENPESETTVNSEARLVLAEVGEKDGAFMQISFEKNGVVRKEFVPIEGVSVIVCEKRKSDLVIEKTGVGALKKGSKAVFVLNYGNTAQIVAYK